MFRFIRKRPSIPRPGRNPVRPRLEVLEDRRLLAPLMVMNGNDSGAGSLRDVVGTAPAGSVINFKAGIGTVNLKTPIDVGTANLTIDGQKMITINGGTSTTLFEVTGSGENINNLTLTAGNGSDGQGHGMNGGAIRVDVGATLGLSGDTVKNNTAPSNNGGGIENDGNLTVSGCTFTQNSAMGPGGAIENTGVLNVTGVASTFSGNSSETRGGAIDSNGSGTLTVSLATFSQNNNAPSGGAIYTSTNTTLTSDSFSENSATSDIKDSGGAVAAVNATANNLTLNVTSCTFIGNSSAFNGGGISAKNFGTDVEQSSFSNNQAGGGIGGAIYISDYGSNAPATLIHTINLDSFTQNQGEMGGGVAVSDSASATAVNLHVYNSTFYNNKAVNNNGGQGGGLYLINSLSGSGSASNLLTNDTFFMNTSDFTGAALQLSLGNSGTGPLSALLTSLTVTGNTATTDGGGLYVNSTLKGVVSLDNNILDGNKVTTKPMGAQDVTLTNAAALTDVGYNLLGTSDNNNFTNGVNNDILNNTTGLAGALAQNGAPAGYPQTLALTAVKGANSPGYETGDPSLATAGAPLNKDERGKTRQTGKVSRGAEDPDAV